MAVVTGCVDTWGVTPRKEWARVMLGGKRITQASNILFSNGQLDPWHNGNEQHCSLPPFKTSCVCVSRCCLGAPGCRQVLCWHYCWLVCATHHDVVELLVACGMRASYTSACMCCVCVGGGGAAMEEGACFHLGGGGAAMEEGACFHLGGGGGGSMWTYLLACCAKHPHRANRAAYIRVCVCTCARVQAASSRICRPP